MPAPHFRVDSAPKTRFGGLHYARRVGRASAVPCVRFPGYLRSRHKPASADSSRSKPDSFRGSRFRIPAHPVKAGPPPPHGSGRRRSALGRRGSRSGRPRIAVPHYGNVMFLSADDKMVYAYLGVWKALDEFGLAPDAMLAESKAVLLAAAWSLGYRADRVASEMLRHPMEGYLRPGTFSGRTIPERFPSRRTGSHPMGYPPGTAKPADSGFALGPT